MGVGGEEKRTRRWELQGVGGGAAAGAKRGCVTAGGATEVDKQARRWALQSVGNGWAPRKRSDGGSAEGVVALTKAPRSSVRGYRCSVGAGFGRSVLVRVCGSVGSWCCGDPGWLVREV